MDLNRVTKKVKPNKREQTGMNRFIEKLLKTTRKLSKIPVPMICGSVEKDTWLSGKYELDLFLLYDPKISKKELEKKGLELAKKIIKVLKGKYEIAFAEHPYLRGSVEKYQIDIVPCYDIKNPEKIKSSVDRTPHHVKFVKTNLENPNDVRLLKSFCISNECYGADVKTLGFSGYLCELLIIKYGSFLKCVKDAMNWRAGQIITFSNAKPEEASSRFKNPLIVVDPVDRKRNVGAAVSTEKFYTFVRACKKFVEKPKEEMFFKRKVRPYKIAEIKNKINERGTKWYMINFKKPNIVDDVLYPQMKRCCNSIEKMLNNQDFKVIRCDFYCGKSCVIVLEMEIWQTPKISKNIGPSVYSRHAEEFLKHYKNRQVFVEDNNWVVESKKEFTIVSAFLKDLFKKSNIGLLERGIPSKIAPVINKCKIYEGEKIFTLIRKMPKDFRIFMRDYFEKNFNVANDKKTSCITKKRKA